MPALCDVNALLAICYEQHVHHQPALAWLNAIDEPAEAVVCRITQLSVLRLLTTPSVMFNKPLDMRGAWRTYDQLMADERFTFQTEPVSLESKLRQLVPGKLTSPKIWQDAYLAAFAISEKLTFVTFDIGFRQFKTLDLILLS
jgi:hypothetical protein